MPERRYSQYKREDVWVQMVQYQEALRIEIVADSVYGNSLSIVRLKGDKNQPSREVLRAVVLARSSDWYYYSLNCIWKNPHNITAVIAGTHDSCIDKPVLAMDAMRWYEPKKMRGDFGEIQPTLDSTDKALSDQFDKARKTQYGSNMLLGALMQGRPDALARLATLAPDTRMRYERKMRKLAKRRSGRPLQVVPAVEEA